MADTEACPLADRRWSVSTRIMYYDRTIAVVVPCRNEQKQIEGVLRTMPSMADRVFVIDDGSTDGTREVVETFMKTDPRVKMLRHETSKGVGGAIATGYRQALAERYDVVVVMAGDGQMDPADFELVVFPVGRNFADYCKGNRFNYQGGIGRIPAVRKFGNFVLSTLTKIVSGYWHVSDTQSGYTAISRLALERIGVDSIYPKYGCPNDILVKLNTANMRVVEVPVNPVYGVGEQSKMQIPRVVMPIVVMMMKQFIRRIFRKYVVTSGHPLVFAYLLACLFLGSAFALGIYLVVMFFETDLIMKAALISCGISLSIGFQLLVTAFWMDWEANRHLCIHLDSDLVERIRRQTVVTLRDTGEPAW